MSTPGPAEAALATMAEEVPSSLFGIVESAVDPLEIAASLESCGLSNAGRPRPPRVERRFHPG